MTVDPYGPSANKNSPQTWNRYNYAHSDPVTSNDPTGAIVDGCGSRYFDFDVWLDFAPMSDSGWCYSAQFYSPIISFLSPPQRTTSRSANCGAANGLTSDQQLAVGTVLGENSWYLLGGNSYQSTDSNGHPTGHRITAATVFSEDQDMFSVLVNRTNTKGYPGTIGAVAAQPNQFLGHSSGMTKLSQAKVSTLGSPLCNDLTGAVIALDDVLNEGSQLPKSYLFWKAINQGQYGFHHYQTGDIYVANTAFGTVNTH